jgi:hypothetical protein
MDLSAMADLATHATGSNWSRIPEAHQTSSPETPNSVVSTLSMQHNLGVSEPLSAFTVFPNLPLEMRTKIWKAAAHIPRIIEVGFGPAGGFTSFNHHLRTVSRTCRRAPAVLHTSHEARTEGLRYYIMTDDFNSFHYHNRPIYFNGVCDIVYFGDNSCTQTLVLLMQSDLNTKISRVAFDLDPSPLPCNGHYICQDARGPPLHFQFGIVSTHALQIAILHGFSTWNPAQAWRWPGCQSVKEVIFITQGQDLALSNQEVHYIDESVTLQPAGAHFLSSLSNSTVPSHVLLTQEIRALNHGDYWGHLFRAGVRYLTIREERFTESNPSISFQHLRLHDCAERFHVNMFFSVSNEAAYDPLGAFIVALNTNSSSRASLYPSTYRQEDGAAIVKIVGRKEDVEGLMGQIRRYCLDQELGMIHEVSQETSPFVFT